MEEKQGPKKSEDNARVEIEDKELDDLLNSALEDFDNPNLLKKSKQDSSTTTINSTECSIDASSDCSGEWENEFTKLQEQFSKLAQNSDVADSDLPNINASLQEAMKSFAEDSEFLKNPISDDDFGKFFQEFSQDEGDASLPGIMPLMQNVMKSLLSKELLYPSLKEVVRKFPTWIDENRNKLEESDLNRYNEQLKLMQNVCTEFESECSSDSSKVKEERFERILSLMQKMQACGQPPEDLVKDVDLPSNLNGITNLEDLNSDKCNIM